MKPNAKTLVLAALSLVLAACSHESSSGWYVPETPEQNEEISTTFTEQPAQATLVLQDESAVLSCTADGETVTYQWYEAADSTGNNGTPIALATGRTLSTPAFSAPGIRYYYCVASAGGMSEKSRVAAVAYTGLPTLYLDLDRPLASVTKNDYALGKMRIVQPDGTEFEYDFTKSGKEGIKGRGNSSWTYDKKGYNIKFTDKQEFFGLPKAKKWCIVANPRDKTLLRNKFASDILGNDILGRREDAEWSPHFMSVDVVVNGEYRGNYIFGEKISLTKGRVDVEDISEVNNLADGGFILEVDNVYYASEPYFVSIRGQHFVFKDPDDISDEIKDHIKNIVDAAEASLYGDNFADKTEGYTKYIDVDSFIDWYIVNELTKNYDAVFTTSVYMYYNPSDSKLHMGPNWDFDISSGNCTLSSCHVPENWYIKNSVWFERLFMDEAFVVKLQERWNAVKGDIFRAVNTDLPALADEIRISAGLNFARWNYLGKIIGHDAPGYETRTTYQSEVDWMMDWLERRYAWLDGAIEGL